MILVFGKTGQVASELALLAPEAMFLGRDQADLSDPAACAAQIAKTKPDMVINAAAYTAVDKAEEEEPLATVINGEAPGAMAQACAELGVPFVHISTDYVFDGAGDTPFATDAATAPLGAYGRSKLLGETQVKAAGGATAIMRTSWVFSPFGNNFVKTMLRLGVTRDRLTVVADQIGGPTPARAIAEAALTMAKQLKDDPAKAGTYHFSGGPDVSWADFAREIFAQANLSVEVVDIPSADYPTPAKRPFNSRMDCSELAVFDLGRPDWTSEITRILALKESV